MAGLWKKITSVLPGFAAGTTTAATPPPAAPASDEEMRWSMDHGREALLDKLIAGGVGQFSVPGRASVVE